MKKLLLLTVVCGLLTATAAPSHAASSKCKQSDVRACLDSACSEDLEPASRCYLCGTSAAKKPEKTAYALGDSPKIQSLSVGKSSKNTLSEKEIKSAPADPGERYQWARRECGKKIKDCDFEDATDGYDKLIDASCKTALGDSEYASTIKKAAVKKTADQCDAELSVCLLSQNKCDGNMLKCGADEEFNRNFSACMVEATGCGEFTTALRDGMKKSRDEMVAKKDGRINDLVALKKLERQNKLEEKKRMCNASNGKNGCMAEMCAGFPIGLGRDGMCADAEEKIWAASLCKFVDLACNKLK
ncbi:MAG: hypothetical protein LBQ49_01465 [Rickettsiales bacterium]|jgi:hypothetical protein|nr:hypothetical protein [Rickettsiales bacterium]